jgi:hypothetical protein
VTPESVSRLFMIIFAAMVVGMSVPANAETVKVNAETVKMMDKASTDGSFIVAQTNGQDRRGNRQDCRQQEGVGADKRNCKQQAR